MLGTGGELAAGILLSGGRLGRAGGSAAKEAGASLSGGRLRGWLSFCRHAACPGCRPFLAASAGFPWGGEESPPFPLFPRHFALFGHRFPLEWQDKKLPFPVFISRRIIEGLRGEAFIFSFFACFPAQGLFLWIEVLKNSDRFLRRRLQSQS